MGPHGHINQVQIPCIQNTVKLTNRMHTDYDNWKDIYIYKRHEKKEKNMLESQSDIKRDNSSTIYCSKFAH